MINIPKGTKDVLPQDSYKWHYVENKIRDICGLYGFKEIRTPVFEHTELFLRSIGDDTDVVSKEMYTFEDKGGRSVTLKPEGTAGVARAFVENALDNLPLPLKMYYLTPVFRYERPQAGRLREHHQFGTEVYGGDSPFVDYEVISLASDVLNSVGVKDLHLEINSIGCKECRPKYNAALKEYFRSNFDKLCPTCRERLDRNPLRILDCKVPECKEIVSGAPKITDYLCEDCEKHIKALERLLKNGGIDYRLNPSIVRGLDYYTKTVFEFVTTSLGAQGTVCGGGRYNDLAQSVGGKPTPAVGFGMGLERLILLLEAVGAYFPDDEGPKVFVISQSPDYAEKCIEITENLRKNGISAETELTGRSFKSQFKLADKLKARYVVIVGESEIKSGVYTVKNLSDGMQTAVNADELTEFIKKA